MRPTAKTQSVSEKSNEAGGVDEGEGANWEQIALLKTRAELKAEIKAELAEEQRKREAELKAEMKAELAEEQRKRENATPSAGEPPGKKQKKESK